MREIGIGTFKPLKICWFENLIDLFERSVISLLCTSNPAVKSAKILKIPSDSQTFIGKKGLSEQRVIQIDCFTLSIKYI